MIWAADVENEDYYIFNKNIWMIFNLDYKYRFEKIITFVSMIIQMCSSLNEHHITRLIGV